MGRKTKRDIGSDLQHAASQFPKMNVKEAEKKVEKVVQKAKKEVRNDMKVVAALSRVPRSLADEDTRIGLQVEKILRSMVKRNPCFTIPIEVRDYIKCLIDPCGATAVRIPDGKARSSAVSSTYNMFSVTGNWAADDPSNVDNGRFCWMFTPTPLNFNFVGKATVFQPQQWPTPGGTIAATFPMTEWSMASFAAEVDPERAWDPTQLFIAAPSPLPDGIEEKRLKRFESFDKRLAAHVKQNPHLKGHPSKDVLRHLEMTRELEELRLKLSSSSKTSVSDRDRLALRYAELLKGTARIEASPQTPAGWKLFPDSDVQFLAGDGNTADPGSIMPAEEYTNGEARTMRPVAQSVWFECTSTEFADGGAVAISFLPANSLIGNVIPNNPGGAGTQYWSRKGPLQNFEQQAALPNQNTGSNKGTATTYCGKFKDGAYAYWLPEDPTDYQFFNPALSALTPFPMIIVSGQNQGNGTDPGIIATLHVNTVYEYETDETSIESKPARNYPGAMEEVAFLMRQFPNAMSNDSHKKWWYYVLKGIGAVGAGSLGFLTGGPAGAVAAAGGVLASM